MRILGVTIAWVATVLFILPCGSSAMADEAKKTQASDLAMKVQNPIANLVSVPFQYNYSYNVGSFERNAANLNFQPIIPFPGENWNVISKTIIPLNSVPVGEDGSVSGIGDVSLSLWWSPAEAGALAWGVGPVFDLPLSSNPEVLGTGKFSLGPTGVFFYKAGQWTLGAWANQVWSIAGDDDRESVSSFSGQWFLNYNLGKAWVIGTAPIITADWNAASGQQWLVPIGLQVSKVVHLGSRPTNLILGYYDYVERPEGAAEYEIRVQINLMYP